MQAYAIILYCVYIHLCIYINVYLYKCMGIHLYGCSGQQLIFALPAFMESICSFIQSMPGR